MRVAFAGSPAAAVPPLRALVEAGHEVTVAVTQPDRARGRSGAPAPTPVAAAAGELGIPVLRPRTINDPEVIEQIAAGGPRALAVVAFGQILREGVLSRWPSINVHFSLLPAYRGAAPVERAIMDGVTRTGVTIMQMDAGLDTGPMLARRAIEIGEDEDAGSVTARLSALGGPLLAEVLTDLDAGRLEPVTQPEEGVSLAPKITPEDRALDLSRPAVELARRVRALSPHIGATLAIGDAPFKVWRARALDEPAPAPLSGEGGRLVAATGDGSLEILELQPPGKGRMDAAAFLRGWRGPLEAEPRPWLRRRPGASPGSAASRCGCCAAWTTAPTPTARWRPRPAARSSTRAPAPRRRGWPTAPCSAGARSTGSSTAPSTGRRRWSRRCGTSCASARTSSPSRTACRPGPRWTRPCARPGRCAAPRPARRRAPGS